MGPPEATKTTTSSDDATGATTATDAVAGVGGTTKTPKVTILRLELPTALKDDAVNRLVEFLQATPHAIEKDMSTHLKKHFDAHHSPTWHCIVGKRFGCSVAYDTQFLLFVQVDQHYVLLFKSAE